MANARGKNGTAVVASGLAVLTAILAITDVALLGQWIRLGRQAAAVEQDVNDAREDLAAIRSRVAAARSRPLAPAAAAPSSPPSEPPVAVVEVERRVPDEATESVANDTPVAPSAADDVPVATTARSPSLEERVKVAEIQTRLDRLLRATIEGHVTLLKPVAEGESVEVQLAGAAEFLHVQVVNERPNSWRIDRVGEGRGASPERIASIGLRGRSLVLSTIASPRSELLRYVAIVLQAVSPREDRVTIPLGSPYRAAFDLAADPPRPTTLRPPLEVSLFRDRMAGARLSRACAADPSLVPVVHIPGVPPRLPPADAAGSGAFEMAIPPEFFATRQLDPSRNVVVLFTRGPEDVGNLDDFRCQFAGMPVRMQMDQRATDVVVKPANAKQLEEACRVQEARALQALKDDPYRYSSERSQAARDAMASREARVAVAAATEALRGLHGDALAKASIRVSLCRPGSDGEIVVIEPPGESSTPRSR